MASATNQETTITETHQSRTKERVKIKERMLQKAGRCGILRCTLHRDIQKSQTTLKIGGFFSIQTRKRIKALDFETE